MAIPATVTICGYPYTILVVDAIARGTDGSFLDGRITYHDAEIEIVKNLPDLFERATVLHEILHGIALHTGQLRFKQDESEINALSFALVNLLRDNPTLVTYLLEP